jgi:hypothetical protein
MNSVPLSPEWRRALELLATAGECGSAEATLIARGFSAEMLKSLLRIGLAMPITDQIQIGRQSWMRITDLGRRMIALGDVT